MAKHLLCSVLVLISSVMACGQDDRMSDRSKELLKGEVGVILSTDKNIYRGGEPIWLTAQIKNLGQTPFFVVDNSHFEDGGDAAFVVRLTDAPQCELLMANMSGSPAPPAKDLSFADYVRKSWRVLNPGDSLESREIFDQVRSPLCPGKYTLGVTYVTELFWWTAERIHASESELPFPAAFGVYHGNSVSFEVVTEERHP